VNVVVSASRYSFLKSFGQRVLVLARLYQARNPTRLRRSAEHESDAAVSRSASR